MLPYDILKNAKHDIKKKVITFGPGEKLFPFNPPDQLYVRDSYPLMYSRIQELIASGQTHIIVSGVRGIGKSHFKYYCMHRAALDENKTPILFEGSQ